MVESWIKELVRKYHEFGTTSEKIDKANDIILQAIERFDALNRNREAVLQIRDNEKAVFTFFKISVEDGETMQTEEAKVEAIGLFAQDKILLTWKKQQQEPKNYFLSLKTLEIIDGEEWSV